MAPKMSEGRSECCLDKVLSALGGVVVVGAIIFSSWLRPSPIR